MNKFLQNEMCIKKPRNWFRYFHSTHQLDVVSAGKFPLNLALPRAPVPCLPCAGGGWHRQRLAVCLPPAAPCRRVAAHDPVSGAIRRYGQKVVTSPPSLSVRPFVSVPLSGCRPSNKHAGTATSSGLIRVCEIQLSQSRFNHAI